MEKSVQVFWTINKAGESFSSLPLSEAGELLSPAENTRFASMKIPKRRNEWLLGRLTAKKLLTSTGLPLYGVPFNTISIENFPEGAPFLASHPHTGSISITHREQIAACAFIADKSTTIGIDLEWVEPRQFSFVEDFFTSTEADYIQRLEAEPIRDEMVTLIWSAKEAILKVWQKGLRLDTRNIEIKLPPISDVPAEEPWQPLTWKSNLPEYPDCWLGWRRWGNFVITMAISGEETPQIIEIKTESPY